MKEINNLIHSKIKQYISKFKHKYQSVSQFIYLKIVTNVLFVSNFDCFGAINHINTLNVAIIYFVFYQFQFFSQTYTTYKYVHDTIIIIITIKTNLLVNTRRQNKTKQKNDLVIAVMSSLRDRDAHGSLPRLDDTC